MKVFLADDSAVIVERLKEMLSPLPGIQIAGCASDAPTALNSIRSTMPQAVILDLRMPGGSGLEVLRKIKMEAPETIVVVLTNYGSLQYRKRCVEAGADAFLDKSTDFADVPQVLRQLEARAGYFEPPPPSPHLVSEPGPKLKVG